MSCGCYQSFYEGWLNHKWQTNLSLNGDYTKEINAASIILIHSLHTHWKGVDYLSNLKNLNIAWGPWEHCNSILHEDEKINTNEELNTSMSE